LVCKHCKTGLVWTGHIFCGFEIFVSCWKGSTKIENRNVTGDQDNAAQENT